MVKAKHLSILSLLLASTSLTVQAENVSQFDEVVLGSYLLGEEGADNINTSTDEAASETVALGEDIEFELAEIRLILEQKKYDEGLKRLDVLSKNNPDNIELVKMKAYAESASGRWSKALDTLDEAEKRFPGNEDLQGVRDDILDGQRDNRDFISIEGEYRKVGSTRKEYFGFLKGRVRVAASTHIGVEGEHNRIYAKEIARPKTGATVY